MHERTESSGTVLSIRRARPADAARLSRFASISFRDTFEADNSPADMEQYLAETFSTEQQETEISDPAAVVLLAEARTSDEDELVGYAHLLTGSSSGPVKGPAPVELRRFYVAREWHGRGVARTLMDAVLAAARERGGGTLWLAVWERNPRAVAFYRKYGFERVGEQRFTLGSDVQTDWVLARSLDEGG